MQQYQGKRTAEVRVRLTDDEKTTAEAEASAAGVSVSAWFRLRAGLRRLAGAQAACACAAHTA